VAHITGHIRIAAPPEQVFDTVADSRNEPSFNSAMTYVELLTPLPIGTGTRFRAYLGKARTEMLVELTDFDRPHLLGSRTTSSMMETSGALTLVSEGDGTVMAWDWQARPKGWTQLFWPVFGLMGARMERKIWTGLKEQLEQGHSRS
jgi:carbon monoxide dehydrogenase subunit G